MDDAKHLLTHVSGLPDQLAENSECEASTRLFRSLLNTRSHTAAIRAGLEVPISSMAILLAARVADG